VPARLAPVLMFGAFDAILVGAGVLPPQGVAKIRQMGGELYDKTHVAAYVAVVNDLNRTKPIDLIERIASDHGVARNDRKRSVPPRR